MGVISVHIAEDFTEFQILQWDGPNGELVVEIVFCNQFALAKAEWDNIVWLFYLTFTQDGGLKQGSVSSSATVYPVYVTLVLF